MHRTSKRTIGLLVLATAALAGCASPKGPEASTTTYPTAVAEVEPATWLPAACGVLDDAVAVTKAPFDAVEGSDRSTEAGRESLRSDLADELAGRSADLVALDRELADLGAPSSRGGTEVVLQLRNGLTELVNRYDRMANELEAVSTASAAEFDAEAQAALAGLDESATVMATAVAVLLQDPAFADLLAADDACRGL